LKDWDVVKAIFYAWGAKTEAAGHNFSPSGPPHTRSAATERGSINKQQILWVNAYEATQCHNPEHHTISLRRCGNLKLSAMHYVVTCNRPADKFLQMSFLTLRS